MIKDSVSCYLRKVLAPQSSSRTCSVVRRCTVCASLALSARRSHSSFPPMATYGRPLVLSGSTPKCWRVALQSTSKTNGESYALAARSAHSIHSLTHSTSNSPTHRSSLTPSSLSLCLSLSPFPSAECRVRADQPVQAVVGAAVAGLLAVAAAVGRRDSGSELRDSRGSRGPVREKRRMGGSRRRKRRRRGRARRATTDREQTRRTIKRAQQMRSEARERRTHRLRMIPGSRAQKAWMWMKAHKMIVSTDRWRPRVVCLHTMH